MPVIDITFNKLEANRKTLDKPVDNIKVSNNSKVLKIEKKKLGNLGEGLVIDFEFTTEYTPDIGSLKVGGSAVFHEKNLKELIDEQKGSIILKPKTFQEVQNFVLGAATMQALVLAKELRLPAPIQLPRVILQEQQKQGKDKGYA